MFLTNLGHGEAHSPVKGSIMSLLDELICIGACVWEVYWVVALNSTNGHQNSVAVLLEVQLHTIFFELL